MLIALLWTAALLLAAWSARTVGEPSSTDALEPRPAGRWSDWWAILVDRRLWLAILFALVGGAAFETVGLLLGPYLIESGMTQADVGRFQLGPVAVALAAGALVGGRVSDRLGHIRVAWFSLLAMVLASLSLGLAEAYSPQGATRAVQLGLIEFEYFVVGVFTASSYALFMDLSAARWKATLFSVFMGATNACESASGFASGQLAATLGFSSTFIIMTVPSLLGLAILPLLRKEP